MKFPVKSIFLSAITFFSAFLYGDSVFEDLDKPPQGSHAGQIFAGATLGMGYGFGSIVNAENDYIKGTTYTFDDAEVTKKVELEHYSLYFSAFGEYQPIDYLGIKARLGRRLIAQKTTFGPDLPNEKKYLYKSTDLILGPSGHFTLRKSWDVVFFPFVGFSYGTVEATPVAKRLFSQYTPHDTSKNYRGLVYGAELSAMIYFSGGFFLGGGVEWARYPVSVPGGISRSNPNPPAEYNNGSTKGNIDSLTFVLSAGYAFDN